VSIPTPPHPDAAPDRYDEVELLEADETIPPRPEEELADILRATPDRSGHGGPDPHDPVAPDA
jgi:hypothetical protein